MFYSPFAMTNLMNGIHQSKSYAVNNILVSHKTAERLSQEMNKKDYVAIQTIIQVLWTNVSASISTAVIAFCFSVLLKGLSSKC